jgi:hypothetical protein
MIEKSMYEAPEGLETLTDEPELEIEIVNPERVTMDDGSVEITLEPGAEDDEPIGHGENLAEYMDDTEMHAVAGELVASVEADIQSRKEWADMFVKGLEVLGLKYEERTEPWAGACGVYSSILTEAAIRFQAETMSETFPAAGPVKTKILGETTREKEQAAVRVGEDMNYQLTEAMPEYRPEHERMLYSLGLAGSAFKKVYKDTVKRRQVSVYVPAEDLILPYGASTIEDAERVTHIMRKTKTEMAKLQASGFYRDIELGEPRSFFTDIEKKKAEDGGYTLQDDERYTLYEIHAYLDMPGHESEDGVPLPYVVTVEYGSNTVLAIRRNWDEDDEIKQKKQYFAHYNYVPGFGIYGLGLVHIVGGYARAGTSLIRQLVDAGTLSNLPGGLKSRGLRIKGDDTPISPGEFRDVDVPSGNIRDNILPMPYKEPSQTLLALLQRITDEGRRLAAISDMNVSDMSANAPVGTTLALLERVLKPMAAVQARVHFAMKQEFKLLKAIIAEDAPESYDYQPYKGSRSARRQDYEMVDVIPVSDPNSSTLAQRIAQYQAVHQLSSTAPQIYDLPYLHRQMIEVLGVKNADKIVPTSEDQKPRDPVSENMAVMVGKPVKAFIYQDHDAHIAAHMSFMQDPSVAGPIGQSPLGQQMMAAIMAHVAEHLAFSYRKKLEDQLGAPLPAPNAELPEGVEVQLSRLVARAGVQLQQMNQQQAAQQQAQQMQQDPMFQLQQAELQIKQQEAQAKMQKAQSDAQLAAQKLQAETQLKAQKLQLDMRKQVSDEELKEQKNVIDAQRAGVMGRSADAQVLREDREQAIRLMQAIQQQNATNALGESGGKQ